MKNKQLLFMGTVALGLLCSYVGAEDVTPPTVTGPFYECTNMTGSIQSATFSVKKKLVLNTINHSVSTIQGTPAEQSTLSGGTLDSVAINTGNVITTLTGDVPEGMMMENGVLYIGSRVSVGTYSVSVQTCEKENNTNCVLSTVEVIIQAVPVFTGTATATGSQVFFSRTCPEGREPKAETYNANETVTVTGSTQAEADTLAKELAKKAVDKDIKDNGQLFADTYGKCVKKEVPTPPIVELPHTGPSITLGTGKQEVYNDDTVSFSFETQSGSMYTAFVCNASEEEMKKTYHIDSEAQGLSGVQQFTALTDVCEQVYAETVTGTSVQLSLSSDNMKNTKILSDVGEKSFYVIKKADEEKIKKCTLDTDKDGIPDIIDIDDDNDGITDIAEGNGIIDTDSDGIPDSLDTDSDNDGAPDNIEGNDADHNGKKDTEPSGIDTNKNGLDDIFEEELGGKAVATQDTDGDGTPDFQDTDDDGDTIPTKDEDSNSDGNLSNDDTNYNNIPNYLDTDNSVWGLSGYNITDEEWDNLTTTYLFSVGEHYAYESSVSDGFDRLHFIGINNKPVSYKDGCLIPDGANYDPREGICYDKGAKTLYNWSGGWGNTGNIKEIKYGGTLTVEYKGKTKEIQLINDGY